MASAFNIKLNGLDKVLSKFDQLDKPLGDKIDARLNQAAVTVATQARGTAPKGRRGRLVGSIQADTGQRFRKVVKAGAGFAAFVEFGTGSQVFRGPYTFTKEERDYARQFYVNGLGQEPSRPFLFPAFHDEIPKVQRDLRQIIFDL